LCKGQRLLLHFMNSPAPSTNDSDADPAFFIGALALLASLLIGSLVYLGEYSLGRDFAGQTPHYRAR
jgi:hypothetical protein